MTKLDLLTDANPVVTDDEWGRTQEGRSLFVSIEEAAETEMLPAVPPGISRPWIYVTVGFAVTIAASLPLLLGGGEESEGVPSDETGFISANTPAAILDDNYVTRAEFEMAADATVQCVVDAGEEASWDYGDDERISIAWTIYAAEPELLTQCEEQHFRAVQFVWNQQNKAPPAEGFYFYASVVRCTEARTGNSYGELTQDSLGFMSTVGQRTLNKAFAEAPAVYEGCFEDVWSQPLHYYSVLECVTEATGSEYPNFTDTGSGQLTIDQIEILDGAREEFPDEFNRCMGEVTVD